MRNAKGATAAILFALIFLCGQSIGQQSQTLPGEGTVRGIVPREPEKDMLRVQTAAVASETAEFAFRLTAATEYFEKRNGESEKVERPKEFKGRTVEVQFKNAEADKIVLQSACNENFCPKKKCAKKCGANPCVCAT
jgi:hypothetical protein